MSDFANTYIVDTDVFTRLATELNLTYTACTYYYSYYTYNVCDSGICNRNANCESGCCDGSRCSIYWCNSNNTLAWLWWLFAFLFLFICIGSCIAQAKRRRRQAELMHHLADSHG